MKSNQMKFLIVIIVVLGTAICTPISDEPETVFLPVETSGDSLPSIKNDLGWKVRLKAFRVAIRDFEFTTGGEMHARLLNGWSRLFVPCARAHGGHYAGGEVIGELSGDFLIDLYSNKPQLLGEAELLTGDYNGINFTFGRASKEDGLDGDDPLLGHTAFLQGTATQQDKKVKFSAIVDVAKKTQMVGGPFELNVTESTSVTLIPKVYLLDPFEHDTLFDGLDFAQLDEDDDGELVIEPGQSAHNILMKTLIRHDHYGMEVL